MFHLFHLKYSLNIAHQAPQIVLSQISSLTTDRNRKFYDPEKRNYNLSQSAAYINTVAQISSINFQTHTDLSILFSYVKH